MITDADAVIEAELYFEQQKIEDDSSKEFLILLLLIKNKLEQGKTLKQVKKIIDSSNINSNMKDTLEKMINEQVSIIADDKTKINLAEVTTAGYTYSEVVKLKQESVRKQLISSMVKMNEAIKDSTPTQEIIDNELTKYKTQLEAFYRTQTKQGREAGYDAVDKEMSKDLRGWISVAVLDNRTSAICIALHNKFYLKKDYPNRYDIPNPPPRHPNCRSILLSVWEGTRITDYKGATLSTFLKNNPKIAQDILGQKKYRIFESGKAKINSFVDIKGSRFYTNDEIIKRLGISNQARLDKINNGSKI